MDADGLDGLSAVSSSRRGARRAGHPPTPPTRSGGCRTWGNLRKSEPFGGSKPRACICIETSLLLLAMILKAQISGFKAEKKILKFHQMAAERKRMAESWCFPKSVTQRQGSLPSWSLVPVLCVTFCQLNGLFAAKARFSNLLD